MDELWYPKVKEDQSNVIDFLDFYYSELEEARKELKLSGMLEKHSAALPSVVEKRFNQLQDIEAVLELLNIELRKTRSKIFRKYLEGYNRALKEREAKEYVDGEQEVVNMTELVNEVALLRNHYLGIMKGLDNKSFQINNITKLRTAGLDDVSL